MNLLSLGEVLFDVYPDQHCLGGAPLNLAAHCIIQGQKATILSAVGNDPLGQECLSLIEGFNIDTSFISILDNVETGKCLVTLDEKGVPSFNIKDNVAYDYLEVPSLEELIDFDTFSFNTLTIRNQHNRQIVKRIMALKHFDEIFCDVNIRPPHYCDETILLCLSSATILKISDAEFDVVCKCALDQQYDYQEAIEKLAEKFPQLKIILYTMGENGAYAYQCQSKQFTYCPVEKVEVVSTVGAGDSFGAGFISHYFAGKDIKTCLQIATKISGYVVSQMGAIPENTPKY